MDLAKPKIKLVFRIDDYSAISPVLIDRKLIDLFNKYQAAFTFGVVPFVFDPATGTNLCLQREKIDLLESALQAGTVDLALHGYAHQERGRSLKGFTEFAGQSAAEQLKMLTAGRAELKTLFPNQPINIFVPPWNSYDLNTLLGLEKLGFSAISADRYGLIPDQTEIKFLPATCHLAELPAVIKVVRDEFAERPPVLVVVAHAVNIQLAELESMLKFLLRQPDIEVCSLTGALSAADSRRQEVRALPYRLILPPVLPAAWADWIFSQPVFFADSLKDARSRFWLLVLVVFILGLGLLSLII